MSGITTAEMYRISVAGTLNELSPTLELAARLSAIHMTDYEGKDLGIGTPYDVADDISHRLAAMRSCISHLHSTADKEVIENKTMRDSLENSLPGLIDTAIDDIKRLDEVNTQLEQLEERIEILQVLSPLGLNLELLSGFKSLSVNLGTTPFLSQCAADLDGLSDDLMVFSSHGKGKSGVLAIYCENSAAEAVERLLTQHDFESITPPDGEGSPAMMLQDIDSEVGGLKSEAENLHASLETWNDANGGLLVGGIEVLERDFEIQTAPVRVAVSEHAFIMEGWVISERAEETVAALSKVATFAESSPFEMPRGRGHHFTGEEVELPPIAFQNFNAAKPFELLTDAVGRPKYGRIDPTTFMFITYPIFFGLMLGDIAYGIAIVAIAWWLSKKFVRNELVIQASGLLFYIGFSTIVFGYIFGEFAGFEYLPHGVCDIEGIVGVAQCEAAHGHYHWEAAAHAPGWVTWMTALYPNGGEIQWMWEGMFGLNLAYPFHRVSTHINDLIILSIYLGILHLALGMILGFREVNREHGIVAAMFEKGSWLLVLGGGFFFVYSFIVSPKHSDADYLALLDMFATVGLIVLGIGVFMVVIMLWKYEGIPLPIAIGLGPLESLQILSNTISYVRIFAVGIVGVKIAETGNEMLYVPMAHTLADFSHAGAMDLILIPVLLIGWLGVQVFALVLGMFSPNVQAARLHFVEWMGKFYETGGVPFVPFGKKLVNVEAD
jgi:V/A-type H+-transporting ATPase subunit I